jgi:DNA polymerase III epsilon subunit family exonuclease
MIFSVLDFETSGLSPKAGRVIETGSVRIDETGEVLDRYETLINPGSREVGATYVHGITSSMVQDAPSFSDAARDILAFLDGTVITAHNAPFDIPFLRSELSRAGFSYPFIPALCTLKLSRRYIRSVRSHSLSSLCAHLGIENEAAHSALSDALATAGLLVHMLRTYDVAEVQDELLVFRSGCAAEDALQLSLIPRDTPVRRQTRSDLQASGGEVPQVQRITEELDRLQNLYLRAAAEDEGEERALRELMRYLSSSLWYTPACTAPPERGFETGMEDYTWEQIRSLLSWCSEGGGGEQVSHWRQVLESGIIARLIFAGRRLLAQLQDV